MSGKNYLIDTNIVIVKSYLKSKGTPIPENDIWITALAKQHSLTLVTRDKHFKNIQELLLESW